MPSTWQIWRLAALLCGKKLKRLMTTVTFCVCGRSCAYYLRNVSVHGRCIWRICSCSVVHQCMYTLLSYTCVCCRVCAVTFHFFLCCGRNSYTLYTEVYGSTRMGPRWLAHTNARSNKCLDLQKGCWICRLWRWSPTQHLHAGERTLWTWYNAQWHNK